MAGREEERLVQPDDSLPARLLLVKHQHRRRGCDAEAELHAGPGRHRGARFEPLFRYGPTETLPSPCASRRAGDFSKMRPSGVLSRCSATRDVRQRCGEPAGVVTVPTEMRSASAEKETPLSPEWSTLRKKSQRPVSFHHWPCSLSSHLSRMEAVSSFNWL